jgi:hypothetical protein
MKSNIFYRTGFGKKSIYNRFNLTIYIKYIISIIIVDFIHRILIYKSIAES